MGTCCWRSCAATSWTLLDGINATALALMAGVSCQLARTAVVDPLTVGIALVTLVLLWKTKLNNGRRPGSTEPRRWEGSTSGWRPAIAVSDMAGGAASVDVVADTEDYGTDIGSVTTWWTCWEVLRA